MLSNSLFEFIHIFVSGPVKDCDQTGFDNLAISRIKGSIEVIMKLEVGAQKNFDPGAEGFLMIEEGL